MCKSHPEWVQVTVEGHADVRGPNDYNQELSQRRAERAREVLVTGGFDAERVAAVGYGRSRPRDDGMTEAAHRRNRRVEFVIVKREGTEP
jgi:peptidoglycan-associated lipoprotein